MVAVAEGMFTRTLTCVHCSTPVPRSRDSHYCCDGCEIAYHIIHEEGLAEYYRRLESTDDRARPVNKTGRTYADFDTPSFTERFVRPRAGGVQTCELYLEGVHCAACLWLVESAVQSVPGVGEARLDLGRSVMSLSWDPSKVALSTLALRLDALGHAPHPPLAAARREARRKDDRTLALRLAVSGAAFGNTMLMAFALYAGLFDGISADFEAMFRWASMLVAVPAIAYSGRTFFHGAWLSFRERTPHMDLPITIGLVLGTVAGVYNTVVGYGSIYFDSLTALVFLLHAGRWLQVKAQRRAGDAAELLHALAPSTARELVDGVEREVATEDVGVGARIAVRAGDHVPIDGRVVVGESTIDASLLTGESRPVRVRAGDEVTAGAINLSGPIELITTTSGRETRVAKLAAMVEDAATRRAPVVLAADRRAPYVVTAVLVLSAITLAVWSVLDPTMALEHAVALLVVSCPCALALATPLAVAAAMGQAARRGILIKGGDTLERLTATGTVWFDKTGTLTEGRQSVRATAGDDTMIALAAPIARATTHPMSRAIADRYEDVDGKAEDVSHVLGAGVRALVDGRRVVLGSRRFMAEEQVTVPSWAELQAARWAGEAWSTVYLGVDDEVAQTFAIGDELRTDAREALAALRARGHHVGILSGDSAEVVEVVARRLGIDREHVTAMARPEDKLHMMERSVGPAIMVGDGVNDAAALSRAHVGIAVHGGAEASLGAAHVFLRTPGVMAVADLFDGAHRTMKVIRRNLIFSLIYNVIGVTLAATGVIGPLGAAILMPLSSLTVVISSYRARTFALPKSKSKSKSDKSLARVAARPAVEGASS